MSTPFAAAVLSSSILSGTSLLYATLGELVGERAGIINLGLEGLMLIGAAVGFAATSLAGDPYLIFGFIEPGRRDADIKVLAPKPKNIRDRAPRQPTRCRPHPDLSGDNRTSQGYVQSAEDEPKGDIRPGRCLSALPAAPYSSQRQIVGHRETPPSSR
jgi:hypothetical protein